MSTNAQPIKIAILAMGGEGGGVLADWIVDLGEHTGHIAQSTSVAGVASAVGALITGRGSDVLRAGATGAAVGGSAGAVSGAFHNDKASPVYRQFVQRCLSEKGFDVIGWN